MLDLVFVHQQGAEVPTPSLLLYSLAPSEPRVYSQGCELIRATLCVVQLEKEAAELQAENQTLATTVALAKESQTRSEEVYLSQHSWPPAHCRLLSQRATVWQAPRPWPRITC